MFSNFLNNNNDKINVGDFVIEKPFVVFGTNTSSTNIWIVVSIEGKIATCDQYSSESIMFETGKEFSINNLNLA